MANKNFLLDDGLEITVYKRRGNRNLRLSVAPSGKVRISIPTWAPYRTGIDFAHKRRDWIRMQQPDPVWLRPGQRVGKAHHLEFEPGLNMTRPSVRVNNSLIKVSYPSAMSPRHGQVQQAAQRGCLRALRLESDSLLPQRLEALARRFGFSYSGVAIKKLKGRWGSCNYKQFVTLNLFLMQLPWHLIDYVLLHELVHTEVLKHGPEFWQAMADVMPDVKTRRQAIKEYRPILNGSGTEPVA